MADLLRGDLKQSQYGRIILPFCLLRRLECVLAPTKEAVLARFQEILPQNLPEEVQEKMLLRASRTPQHPDGLSFFNTSMDLSTLGETGIKANLENYIQGFSKDAREIFEHFKFMDFMALLNDANLLMQERRTALIPAAVTGKIDVRLHASRPTGSA